MLRHRFWLPLIVTLAMFARDTAYSQEKATPQAAGTRAPALTPEQARSVLDTLNDPKKRAAFEATLETLVRAQPEPAAAPPPQPAAAQESAPPSGEGIAIQLAPDSLGAEVLLTVSAFLNNMADKVPRAIKAAQSLPLLWGWMVVMVTNPLGRQLLADAGWRLLVDLVLAGGFAFAIRYLLRRPMARILGLGDRQDVSIAEADDDHEARAELGAIEAPVRGPWTDGLGRRLGLGLARFALQMVPILGLLLAGHAVAGSSLGGPPSTRLIILAVLDASAGCLALLAVVNLLFRPDPPGLKLLAIRPSAGAYLVRWGRRLILIAVPGYAIGEVGLLLGLSPLAHGALQKAVGLVLTICLGMIVVQRRRQVRQWLSCPPEATGVVAQLRNRLALFWHWLALALLAAIWLTWTLQAPDAMARIVWYFAVTVAVLVVASIARLAATALLAPLRPGLPDGSSDEAALTAAHSIRVRLSFYHAALVHLTGLVIGVFALLGLLQLYGLGGLAWLSESAVGHRIVSGVCTLAVTIIFAFVVWEAVNIVIQIHLETLRRDAQVARSARLRTLLPLIRTTLAITVVVVAGLMVLSEIGVNIAPLLAGAGIVGVAIGFGSQKLVQDVITGVFLLLENAMQVGDVVKVGDQSGLVESLSVRTIRLRTEDGSVVVMPFSAVTTVINMTRDYSRAVVTVNVSVDEDVDGVVATMRDIVREMREEDTWSTIILDELEVFGLDRFTDTALQIKCRIMCTPFGRWTVGREFNRRLKMRFQVIGVSNAFSALRLLPHEVSADSGHESAGEKASAAEPMPVVSAAQ
jgi:small-conductance mechanosensitive channel